MKIGVLPVGYFDGYRRKMPEGSFVLVKGLPAPLVGLVNMNSCTVDLTGIEGVEEGEEVILMGGNPGHEVHPESFFSPQEHVDGIEFPCRINPGIQRVIVWEAYQE